MSDSQEKFRLVTRSDFDGLVCAVLLKHLNMIDDILFVHPKDMQDGKIDITTRDISTNLPYVEGVNMLNSMDADGVKNIIYLGYYHTVGAQSNLAQAVDYGDLRLSQACSNTTANCSYVDPRSSIVASDIIGDGIHPNSSGSQKLANLIWPKLQPLL